MNSDDLTHLAADPHDSEDWLLNQCLLEEQEFEARELRSRQRIAQGHDAAIAGVELADGDQAEDPASLGIALLKIELPGQHWRRYFKFAKLLLRWKRQWRGDFKHRAHVAAEILSGKPCRKSKTVVGALRKFVQIAAVATANPHQVVYLMNIVIDGSGTSGDDVTNFLVAKELDGPLGIRRLLIDALVEVAEDGEYEYSMIEVIRSEMLVDVTNMVNDPTYTGIQRVASEIANTVVKGDAGHVVHWNDSTGSLKRINWPLSSSDLLEVNGTTLIPLDCTYFTVEVPSRSVLDQIYTLKSTGLLSSSVAVVHDLIPIQHPDLVTQNVLEDFVLYCDTIREFDLLVANSLSTQNEFLNWLPAYPFAGRHQPVVECVPLPNVPPVIDELVEDILSSISHEKETQRSSQRVVIVGTFEPRKNQIRSLRACENLWQRGYDLEVVLVGYGGWPDYPVDRAVELLVRKRRPILIRQGVSNIELAGLIGSADVVMYPSLAEGFGLPAVEALALGANLVVSQVPALAGLQDDRIFLANPLDISSISVALEQALSQERTAFEGFVGIDDSWDRYVAEVLARVRTFNDVD